MKQNGYKIYNVIEISLLMAVCVPFFWDFHKNEKNSDVSQKPFKRKFSSPFGNVNYI